MLEEWLQTRVPDARFFDVGYVTGRRLRFHKRSTDGSAKCDVPGSSCDSDIVWGVVFDVPDNKIGALDKAESGYARTTMEVLREEVPLVLAAAYVANPGNIDCHLRPYTWYRGLVVAGACQHNLPVEYIAQLTAVVAVADLDRERGALALKAIDEYDERQSITLNKPSMAQGTEKPKADQRGIGWF